MVMSSSSAVAKGSLRAIRRILPAQPRHWVGDGFNVFPVFADLAFQQELSPFLMFDYAAPKEFSPTSKRRGVGQHPHRGFETVTIAFQGEVEHRDSVGNSGVIGPGDIQWMTAGRGIIHEEFHSTEFSEKGGTFEMCQLWVNLPSDKKMTAPQYQPILNEDVPTVSLETSGTKEAKARVIAGVLAGQHGPAKTHSPVELWDVEIPEKDSVVNLPFVDGHNCIVFVRRGGVEIEGSNDESEAVGPQGVALMEQHGDVVRIKATSDDTSVLVMGGEPLNEPIAARGPFVMNTFEEIQEAAMDFRNGRFGT